MRLFRSHQHRHGDRHVLTMRSRFIPEGILDLFERRADGDARHRPALATASVIRVDVGARMREMWD
jgi:DNA helicase-2/ATP-dependent DNA helicase PcrA